MACAIRSGLGLQCPSTARQVSSSRRPCLCRAAKQDEAPKMQATGFIEEDNSGRANIFPTKQQAYIKSGSDGVANTGLGGIQGAGVVVALIAAVAAATLLTSKSDGPETLATVANNFNGDSLNAIAARIEASL